MWMRQVDMFIEVITCTIYCIVGAEYIVNEGIPGTFVRIIYHQFVRIWGELRDHWRKLSINSRDTLLRFIILWGHLHHTNAITNAFCEKYVATFINFIAKTNLLYVFWQYVEITSISLNCTLNFMKISGCITNISKLADFHSMSMSITVYFINQCYKNHNSCRWA